MFFIYLLGHLLNLYLLAEGMLLDGLAVFVYASLAG